MKHLLRLLPLALLALAALPAAAGDAAPVAPAPDDLLVDTLENGLQVVIEEQHAVPIVHVRALMRIGALYEGEYLGSGLSHYMEHIVSGGSTRRQEEGPNGTLHWVGRTEEENKALLKSIGGYANASTFFDYTNYYITTKSEMVETAVDLISGYLQHCQFDSTEVEREQRVVQQELLRNLDNPGRFRNQLFTDTMFKVHPCRVPVIGYVDCIERLTRDDMFAFYRKHYTPQNCVVAVVGDVDKHEMLELVRSYFGGWKRKPLEPYQIPQEPEQTATRWVEKEFGGTQTCLVNFGVPTIPLSHPDLYALDTLANVLGASPSARLPRVFEHDPQREVLATGVYCGNWTPSFGGGRLAVGFETDTLENARTLVREMWAEMRRLQEELVSPDEIARALKAVEKQNYEAKADVESRAQSLAANLAWQNDPLYSDGYVEKMRSVTPEQVREMAQKYLAPQRLCVSIVTPPAPATRAEASGPKERESDVREVKLDNGLTLLLKRLPGYGMVDVAAALAGGVIHEDEATNGLFLLMANSFWRGTESRPFPVLMQTMDELGVELGAESHNNLWYVKMRSLAADLEPAFDLFADVLLHPTIDPQWVERIKGILLTRVLPNLEVSPEEIGEKVVRNTLYTDSPYRRQRFGTRESVASFDAAQVRALYETFARPNNCVLAIYGDIDLDETEQLVRRALGSWEPGEIPSSLVREDAGLTEPKTVELTNDQVRTNYRLAWRAFGRQDVERRAAVSVMNTIMGSNGWLQARLREGAADYVYAVFSQPYLGDTVGHFQVITDFSPQDETQVLEIIDGVVSDMRAGKFTDEELELAKKMILCYDALGKKEIANLASGDALSVLYGEGLDADERHYERVKAVTREDVVRVANEIFSRPALRVLVRPKAATEQDKDPGT